MPECARCHDWTPPSAGLAVCPVCSAEFVAPADPAAGLGDVDADLAEARRRRVATQRLNAYRERTANEWMDGVVFVVLVAATIFTALLASIVAGLLARSIAAFGLSLVGGLVLGLAWYAVPGRLRVTRWPGPLRSAAYYGGPIAAVVVAAVVATGNTSAVVSVLVVTLLLAAARLGWILLDRAAHRHDDPAAPLSLTKRLGRLETLHAEGRLTTEEYEAISADVRSQARSRSP